jgi:hypothetical protein
MPKRKTTHAPSALTFEAAERLTQPERLTRFQAEAGAGQRAFASMAKLFRVMEANLAPGEAIFPLLIGAGIKKGTVSNASIAASVFDLVRDGKLTEEEFDQLSFNDCWQTKRVLSRQSKKQLSVDEVVAAIRERCDFAEEFAALYEHGTTAAQQPAKETPAGKESKPSKGPESKPAKDENEITAEQLIDWLDEIELAMAGLPEGEQSLVGAKLVEMASAYIDAGKSVRDRKKLAA